MAWLKKHSYADHSTMWWDDDNKGDRYIGIERWDRERPWRYSVVCSAKLHERGTVLSGPYTSLRAAKAAWLLYVSAYGDRVP